MCFNIKYREFYNFGAFRIVKTCPFRILRNHSGDSFNVMFPQFPNHFPPFSMMFPHVSPSVSIISSVVLLFHLSVFPVSYIRFCELIMPVMRMAMHNT